MTAKDKCTNCGKKVTEPIVVGSNIKCKQCFLRDYQEEFNEYAKAEKIKLLEGILSTEEKFTDISKKILEQELKTLKNG